MLSVFRVVSSLCSPDSSTTGAPLQRVLGISRILECLEAISDAAAGVEILPPQRDPATFQHIAQNRREFSLLQNDDECWEHRNASTFPTDPGAWYTQGLKSLLCLSFTYEIFNRYIYGQTVAGSKS